MRAFRQMILVAIMLYAGLGNRALGATSVGAESAANGGISVRTLACGGGITANSSIDDFLNNCQGQQLFVNVSVLNASDNLKVREEIGGTDTVEFDLAAGMFIINAPIPAPFTDARVACQTFDTGGNQISTTGLLAPSLQGSIDASIDISGNILACNWFYFTDAESGQAPPVITGQVLLCDSDFAGLPLENFTSEVINNGCDQLGNNVLVFLDDTDGITTQGTTDDQGNFQFSPLKGGPFQISVDKPAGFDEMTPFCTSFDLNGAIIESTAFGADGEGKSPIDGAIGTTVNCIVLIYDTNGPSPLPPSTASILITSFSCPEGSTLDDAVADLEEKCSDPNAQFSFMIESGDTTDMKLIGDPTAGGVRWDDLTPGEWKITQWTPAGFLQSAVYCTQTSDADPNTGSPVQMVTTNDGHTITQNINAGVLLNCEWFTMFVAPPATATPTQPPAPAPTATKTDDGGSILPKPATGPATLIINLYTCPDFYEIDAFDSDPTANCDQLTDDVQIVAINAKNSKKRATTGKSDEGVAEIGNLKAGIYRIQETYPDDVQTGVVLSCESDQREFEYPYIPFARLDATGAIKIELIAGETLSCDWYNIPAPANAEGSGIQVNVTVFECDGIANQAACDPAESGVGVSLQQVDGGGGPIDFETDESGVASTNVAPGTYSIDADTPPCFVDSTASTADGNLDLRGESPIEVSLFVCN